MIEVKYCIDINQREYVSFSNSKKEIVFAVAFKI